MLIAEYTLKYIVISKYSILGGMYMIKLENWTLDRCVDINERVYIYMRGIAYGHPHVSDGTNVRTSMIKDSSFDKGAKKILVTTQSGSNYELKFEDINYMPDSIKNIRDSFQVLNISTDIIDESKILARVKNTIRLIEADKLTGNGDLLLEMAGSKVAYAYFKKKGRVYPCTISYHGGMFQDSILIRKSGIVDYRYFPKANCLETYHVSNGIKRLVIKNDGSEDIILDNEVFKSHTITEYCVGDNYCEGLFSPDCVDGKNMFSH